MLEIVGSRGDWLESLANLPKNPLPPQLALIDRDVLIPQSSRG